MNSGLQCLSNTYGLTEFFLQNRHAKDINEGNPLGSGGQLVRKYCSFLKNMWNGYEEVFSPWGLKNAIQQFQTMVRESR